jgi:SAM-dependent methyltransferase
VTSIDIEPPRIPVPRFLRADLGVGLPLRDDELFDVILLADVLEHVAEPRVVLREAVAHLDSGGQLLVSLPNAVHWSVRLQVLRGRFEYTNRGILDRGHLRFFTKESAVRLFVEEGLRVRHHQTVPVPWEHVVPKPLSGVSRAIERFDYLLTQTRPNLFAYQHVFELGHAGEHPSEPH